MSKQFVIGASRRIITPPLKTPLAGYPYERPADSVNDDLTVNAVAMGYDKVTAILISIDIACIDDAVYETISSLISKQTNIKQNNIILCAIHTHSAPATQSGWAGKNDSYIDEILVPMAVEAARKAVDNVQPAVMGIGTTNSYAGINRRELTRDGKVVLGQNPYGIFDPEMTVLAFKTLDGKPIVNLVHYGAHATAAGEGPEITRDWPGYMVDSMEKNTSALTVFINGASGDTGPRCSNGKTTGGKPYGDIMMACEVGSIAALDAIRAYRSIKEYKKVSFKTHSDKIKLPYKPLPPIEEMRRERDAMGDPSKLIETDIMKYSFFDSKIKMLENGIKQDEYAIMNQVLFAFNEVVLVPFQFEMFSEITLRLRSYSPFQHTLAISYGNGHAGYLPSQDQLCRGGYEVEMFKYFAKAGLADNTDDNIINESLKNIDKLKKE